MAAVTATPEKTEFKPKAKWRPSLGLVVLVVSLAAAVWPATLAGRVSVGALDSLGPFEVRPTHSVDLFVLAFLVAAGAPSIHWHLARKRRLDMENRLPDFLNDLAALHKAGLTLPESLKNAATGNYGPLTKHVRWAADQIRWNLPILTVMENLRDRIGTPIAQRSLTVVIEAGRSGGNVPEVLEATALNTRSFVNMRETRRRAMSMYTIIVYVASFVFIGVALALQAIFVPRLIEAFANTGAGGSSLGFQALPPADSFRSLFYVGAVVQSIGNGLVAGVMSDGRLVGGLRHACTMTALVFLGFALAA
jgi:flagellar protein FlaJ